MATPVRRVVVVGGGTAGWLTAGIIAATSRAERSEPLEVTLVESPGIPIIGVGEGTWPTMRRTLQQMGVRETDFIRACSACFKQGAKFARWATGAEDDFYYHPLMLPEGYFDENLAAHWLADNRGQSFSTAVCPQEELCEMGLAPKSITTAEYDGVANYAYHLDAGAFASFIRAHCVDSLGIRHIEADVDSVRAKENGDIAAVVTRQAGEVAGDLFIDCTGFRSVLLGGHFGVGFRSCKDILFIDRALAMQVPYVEPDSRIASHTISTAQRSGWVWDIGLQTRRGVGHVYSSAHMDDDTAEACLRAYIRSTGSDPDALSVRKLTIEPGHREKFWVGNCAAVGLSAGFLEPLEASAILLIEISARFIAEQMPPTRESMDVIADRFNRTFAYRWERIIDFLKLHYVLSKRIDDDFWHDNRAPASVPESLSELLKLWRHKPPSNDDFDRAVEVFPGASYQYVLYGMGFETDLAGVSRSEASRQRAEKFFEAKRHDLQAMRASLPPNRDLLDRIAKYGLQKV